MITVDPVDDGSIFGRVAVHLNTDTGEGHGMASALRFGLLSAGTVHLCIDMQTLFAERTDWHVPWFERVLPAVARPTEARRARTGFHPLRAARVTGGGGWSLAALLSLVQDDGCPA